MMIKNRMKPRLVYKYGEVNEYGELDNSLIPLGTILISIDLLSQNITDNALYKDASYIGLTFNKTLGDNNVIEYGEEKLKVLYVNNAGRYSQVFLQKI